MHNAVSTFFQALLPNFDPIKLAVAIRTAFNTLLAVASVGAADVLVQVTTWAMSPDFTQTLTINWREAIRSAVLAGLPVLATLLNSVRKNWLPSNERLATNLAQVPYPTGQMANTKGGTNDPS